MDEKKENVVTTNESTVFMSSLVRNNKQLKEDRAAAIYEDTKLTYKRLIEDLEISIRKMKREQENMLDLGVTNTTSLIVPSDFDHAAYASKDSQLSLKIQMAEKELEIKNDRYIYLFGK